jgi:hypothetical protein
VVPDLENDKNLGMAVKYHIAWGGTIDEVLSESAFFSIAHILESNAELDCSILLSSNLYYKQALQILRNYIENMVLQLHFSDENDDFLLWKAGKYRVPFLRGKKGLLSLLKEKGLIPSDLVHVADKLYEELNGSIHGAESRLIHRGIFTGDWTGLLFKYDRFKEWCDFFARSVNFGIHLLSLHIKHWAKVRPKNYISCDVCHNEDFEIKKSEFSGKLMATLSCRVCGNSQTYDADYLMRLGYI